MNDFKLIDKIKWLTDYINKYIFSIFPKKEISLKIKIDDNLYNLLENTMRANINIGNIRNKYQKEALLNISMLDYYFGYLLERKLIKKKRFISCVNSLNLIRKMLYGWIDEKKY